MKRLFSGNTQTDMSIIDAREVNLNGANQHLDAAVDLGLSIGEARRVTIAIWLSGLLPDRESHDITIQPYMKDSPGGGDETAYYWLIPVIQTLAYIGRRAVLLFNTSVYYFSGESRYFKMRIQSNNWPDEHVTFAASVFSDGFDKNSRVDVGNINGADAGLLAKSAKMLLNKAVQDKLTGAIEYMDDDGETVILTHTPTEDESSFTRTPS
jgi:hypothetical protein